MTLTRAHVVVRGRVQGVWFRASTRRLAQELGLHGWVRNRADGSVEAVFEGPTGAVDLALAFVRRGPENARVDDVEVLAHEAIDAPREAGFRVR